MSPFPQDTVQTPYQNIKSLSHFGPCFSFQLLLLPMPTIVVYLPTLPNSFLFLFPKRPQNLCTFCSLFPLPTTPLSLLPSLSLCHMYTHFIPNSSSSFRARLRGHFVQKPSLNSQLQIRCPSSVFFLSTAMIT